jgi:pimeloyl-ACP methyl ester carboxylesterase
MNGLNSGFAHINGAKIYYESMGEGHPFVMVHAAIAHLAMWGEQVDYFKNNYRVIRYDMRGFGKSLPVPRIDFQHDEDLRALMDFLNIDRAYLMGCSKGGSVCMNFALNNPDRVAALIMVGSAPQGFSYPDWSPTPLIEAMEAAYGAGDLDQINELAMRMFVDGKGRTPDQVNSAMRKKIYDMYAIALQHEKQQGNELPQPYSAMNRLAELPMPVQIIYGDLDEDYTLRAADFMLKHIKHVRATLMHGTAHLPNMEFPQAFNTHLSEFLRTLTR